jgi:hypothetical protein
LLSKTLIALWNDTLAPQSQPSPPHTHQRVWDCGHDGGAGDFLLSGPKGLNPPIIWKLVVKVC